MDITNILPRQHKSVEIPRPFRAPALLSRHSWRARNDDNNMFLCSGLVVDYRTRNQEVAV